MWEPRRLTTYGPSRLVAAIALTVPIFVSVCSFWKAIWRRVIFWINESLGWDTNQLSGVSRVMPYTVSYTTDGLSSSSQLYSVINWHLVYYGNTDTILVWLYQVFVYIYIKLNQFTFGNLCELFVGDEIERRPRLMVRWLRDMERDTRGAREMNNPLLV
jgi:hypothetical protein